MKAFHRAVLRTWHAVLLLAAGLVLVRGGEARSGINWSEFLARHDLVWESLPQVWHEAAFIGNGLLGATIYAEGAHTLQWDVGRSDVVDRGGRIAIGRYAVAWGERPLSPGQRVFVFTVDYAKTGMPVTAKAVADIQAVLKADFNETVRTHRAWWQTYYPRSFLSVPDTRLESFYWIQMYKLASGTRADRPALDLMGPWFRRTPWPKIWWNLNLQLTYWPVYAANRLDLGESLTRMIDANISNLIDNVRNGRRITALDLPKEKPCGSRRRTPN
jgi:hypothetical protein